MMCVCGNCSYFTYEGMYSKGYCSCYKCYCYPTDNGCRYFTEGTENVY